MYIAPPVDGEEATAEAEGENVSNEAKNTQKKEATHPQLRGGQIRSCSQLDSHLWAENELSQQDLQQTCSAVHQEGVEVAQFRHGRPIVMETALVMR